MELTDSPPATTLPPAGFAITLTRLFFFFKVDISEILERLHHIKTDATSLPQKMEGVSAVFSIGFFVSHVHFCVIGFALSLLLPRINFALQNRQRKAVLRLFPPRRDLVNILRITRGIPFWNCSFPNS